MTPRIRASSSRSAAPSVSRASDVTRSVELSAQRRSSHRPVSRLRDHPPAVNLRRTPRVASEHPWADDHHQHRRGRSAQSCRTVPSGAGSATGDRVVPMCGGRCAVAACLVRRRRGGRVAGQLVPPVEVVADGIERGTRRRLQLHIGAGGRCHLHPLREVQPARPQLN